jgi:hypothetical protein
MIQELDQNDLLLKHKFNMIVSAGTMAGKTEWVSRLIRERDRMIDTKIERIFYHYGIYTEDVLELQKLGIETIPGMPDPKTYFKHDNPPTLLILDDLITDATEAFLQRLFTFGTHHCNISTIFITQDLFAKQLKVARSNTQYFVLMRNPPGLREVRNFALQIYPKNFKFFMDCYDDAINEEYGFLFVNLHTKSPPILKLQTHIFDTPIVYSN